MSGRGRGRGRGAPAAHQERRPATFRPREKRGNAVTMARQAGMAQLISTVAASDTSSVSAIRAIDFTVFQSPSTVKRIYRDYVEFMATMEKNPLLTIAAKPINDNLFTWHGNMLGPEKTVWNGALIHFQLNFPEDYPLSPPTVTFFTKLNHPCVNSSNQAVLEILTQFSSDAPDATAWRYDYSIISVLYQLQSFLFEGSLEATTRGLTDPSQYRLKKSEYESAATWVVEQSKTYSCSQCKHTGTKPIPKLPTSVKPVAPTPEELQTQHFRCYYSKKTSLNDCLGMGIAFSKNIRTGKIQNPSTKGDLLSLSAFNNQKVRVSADCGTTFTHWLPVLLTDVHAEKAMYLAQRSLSLIYAGTHTNYSPEFALDFFPQLLISVGVSAAHQIVRGNNFSGLLHAINTYSLIHRLFLQFLKLNPELYETAQSRLQDFISNPEERHKDTSPNLGVYMIYASLAPTPWSKKFVDAYLEESLTRNAMWLLQAHPDLDPAQTIRPTVEDQRLAWTWQCGAVSHQLFLFHYSFHQTLLSSAQMSSHLPSSSSASDSPSSATKSAPKKGAKPKEEKIIPTSAPSSSSSPSFAGTAAYIDALCKLYDSSHGLLPLVVSDMLVEKLAANFSKITGYVEFFKFLEPVIQKAYTVQEISDNLKKCIQVSAEKKYHGERSFQVLTPEEWEQQRQAKIERLEDMVEGGGKGGKGKEKEEKSKQVVGVLHNDETKWRTQCASRWGIDSLPEGVTTWKELYLQNNLQDLLMSFNDNPDFLLLYKTLQLSGPALTNLQFTTFDPTNIKSRHYFITQLIALLPNLSHFSIVKGEVGLGARGFRALVRGLTRSAGNISVLDMQQSDIDEHCVAELAQSHLSNDKLSRLNLQGNPLSTTGTIHLSQLFLRHHSLPNLQYLNLKACQITDDGAKNLAEGLLVKRNIRVLDLSSNNFSATGLGEILKSLAFNPVIEEVYMNDLKSVSRGDLDPALAKLLTLTVSLKLMTFWKTPIGASFKTGAMKALGYNKTLTSLDLCASNFDDSGCPDLGLALAYNTTLTSLNLENCRISPVGLKAINAAFREEEEEEEEEDQEGKEDEDDDKVKDEDKRSTHSSLTELNLKNNSNLTSGLFQTGGKIKGKKKKQPVRGVAQVQWGAPVRKAETTNDIFFKFFSSSMRNVTVLNLEGSIANMPAFEILGNVLASPLISLEELNLDNNRMDKHAARFLFAGLAKNQGLKKLSLCGNRFGAAGAQFLASALPHCGLKSLLIFGNFIEVPGARSLAAAVASNTTLETLDVGFNRLRKNGFAAFIDALSKNTTLKNFHFKYNYANDQSFLELANVLSAFPKSSIVSLVSAGNSLSYTGLVTFLTILKTVKRTISFDLAARAVFMEPEVLEATVYVTPLSGNISADMIKKFFYAQKCGAIVNVTIKSHKKRKAVFEKSKYAFVHFAHKDSVELAIDLSTRRPQDCKIGRGQSLKIIRAGVLDVGSGASAVRKSKDTIVWS